jgi:hypothetical protein
VFSTVSLIVNKRHESVESCLVFRVRRLFRACGTTWGLNHFLATRCLGTLPGKKLCVETNGGDTVLSGRMKSNTEGVEFDGTFDRVEKLVPKQALVLRKKCYIILHTVPMFWDKLRMSQNIGTRDPTHSTLTPPR